MMFRYGIVLLAFASTSAAAQDFLDPPQPVIGLLTTRFDENNVASLKSAFTGDERVYAAFEPAFTPEFVVGLRGGGKSYRIFAAIPEFTKDGRRIREIPGIASPPLMGLDGKRLPKEEEDRILAGRHTGTTDIRLRQCEIPIQAELASRIVAAWDKVVLRTKFHSDMPRLAIDGVFIQFASILRYRVAAGVTWSPQPPGHPGELARAADAMYRLCFDPRGRTAEDNWRELRISIAGIK